MHNFVMSGAVWIGNFLTRVIPYISEHGTEHHVSLTVPFLTPILDREHVMYTCPFSENDVSDGSFQTIFMDKITQ